MNQLPFVCLHGFTGGPESFSSLGLNPVWTPKLSGHGPDPDLSAQSFDEEVVRLAEGLRGRGFAPVHLLGYSMGARVALGLLQRAPDLIARATLVGLNPGLGSEADRQTRRDWETSWVRVLEDLGLEAFEEQWSRLPLFSSQAGVSAQDQEVQRSIRLSHTAKGLAHAIRALGLASMPDYWPTLSTVTRPVDLVFGEEDEKFASLMTRAKQTNRLFRAIAVPGVGHNPLLEAPEILRGIALASRTEEPT